MSRNGWCFNTELFLCQVNHFQMCSEPICERIFSTFHYSFMKEVHKCAPVAICSCLFMIRIILADDSIMPESFKDMNLDVMSKNGNKIVIQRTADVIHLAKKYRFFFKD